MWSGLFHKNWDVSCARWPSTPSGFTCMAIRHWPCRYPVSENKLTCCWSCVICYTKHPLNVPICFSFGVPLVFFFFYLVLNMKMCSSVKFNQTRCFHSQKWYFVIFTVNEFHIIKWKKNPNCIRSASVYCVYVLFTPHMVKDLMLLGVPLTHMLSCVFHRVTVNKC